MCDKAILENGGTLKSVPECKKNQQLRVKLLTITLMHKNLFLNAIRLERCVIKQFIRCFLYLILFLINVKLKIYKT